MNSKKFHIRKSVALIGLLLPLALAFQNCGGDFDSTDEQFEELTKTKSLGDDYLLSAPLEMDEESLLGDSGEQSVGALDLTNFSEELLTADLSQVAIHLEGEDFADRRQMESARFRIQGEGLNSRTFIWTQSEIEAVLPHSFEFTFLSGVNLQVGVLVQKDNGEVLVSCAVFRSTGTEQKVMVYLESMGVMAPNDLIERVGDCIFDPPL